MWIYFPTIATVFLAMLQLGKDWVAHQTNLRRVAVLFFIMGFGITAAINTYSLTHASHRQRDADQKRIAALEESISAVNFKLDRIVMLLQPKINRATLSAPPSVTLSWVASKSMNVIGYFVYRSNSLAGPYAKITANPITAVTYEDTAVTRGITYYYEITTVDSNNIESAFSNPVSATISKKQVGSVSRIMSKRKAAAK